MKKNKCDFLVKTAPQAALLAVRGAMFYQMPFLFKRMIKREMKHEMSRHGRPDFFF